MPGVAAYDIETVVELAAVRAGVRMVVTIDAMHDEHWTEMAVKGWESQLDKARASSRRASADWYPSERQPHDEENAMSKPTPFLWFDNDAEEAMNFYVSIFPNSKVVSTTRYPAGAPAPAGSVMTVQFQLDGQEFVGLNGGPTYKFTEAVSFTVSCETQNEVDRYWEKLSAGRRPARPLRLAQGQVRPLLADRPHDPAEAALGQGRGQVGPGDGRHDEDGEARRRRAQARVRWKVIGKVIE